MRARAPVKPAFGPPPQRLLHWDGPVRAAPEWARAAVPQPRPGEPVGQEVYASRPEWAAARRAWEAEHGQSIAAWYAEAVAEARAGHGLDGWAAMRPYRPDPDEAEVWRDEW